MKIGVPKEIKPQERRVALTPAGVHELTVLGHQVYVQAAAGRALGFEDKAYTHAGATVLQDAKELWDMATLVLKVKEPQPLECEWLRPDHILFAYLHLAPDKQQTQSLLESRCTAIAYETVTDAKGGLPLLAPMSEVAGRLSVQAGAYCLEGERGGRGVLLGGVPGVAPAHVVIIGGGVVGTNAARIAIGMGARVTLIDRSIERLRYLDEIWGARLTTLYSTADNIEQSVVAADLVIGAVLLPGAAAPKLVSAATVKNMLPGSVLVDVAIDQGGCFETSQPTTHAQPSYIVDDVVHYCVANMPGAVGRTSALALTNATLPYIKLLAEYGHEALTNNPHLLNGLNCYGGSVTCKPVALAQDLDFLDPGTLPFFSRNK